MQTLFHENPNRQLITNDQLCMVQVHTKPEYQMMTPDTGAVGAAPLFELGSVWCGFWANKAFPHCLINI